MFELGVLACCSAAKGLQQPDQGSGRFVGHVAEDSGVHDTHSLEPFPHENCGMTLVSLNSGWALDFCNRRGIFYLMANTEIPVEQLVSSYLRKRGLVR